MMFYVTKYAMSKGIYSVSVIEEGGDYVRSEFDRWDCYRKEKDGSLDKETAILMAENIRVKRIKSLERQIQYLKEIKFE